MNIDAQTVKKLREKTGIGMMECKKALIEASGDIEKAIEILRKKGYEKAKAKSSRAANQGIVSAYIHTNNKIGVMLELACETDFVAKNKDFQILAKDIAMQIAALNPTYITEKNIPEEILNKEKEIYREQLKNSGKPDKVIDQIIEGKLKKYFQDVCLLKQSFFKEDKKTIEDLITGYIHKLGENILVKRFVRFQMGEEC